MYLRDRSSPRTRDRRRRCEDLARLAIATATGVMLICPDIGQAQPVASSIDPSAVDPPPRPRSEPAIEPAPRPVPEPTAADVARAPVPGQESGRVDRPSEGDSPPRLFLRGILFVPKLAVQTVLAPVRLGIWTNERYRVHERVVDLLFNDERTIGLYPTVGLQSDFGATIGAKLVHRDLLGAGERFSLSAKTGGRFRRSFAASLGTGDRFGERFELALRGEHDRRPRERFYGIGNRDELDAMAPAPIDALDDPAAVESRYRQQLARATALADVRIAGGLHVLGAGALTDVEVGRGEEGASIDEVYEVGSLVGWTGARHAYGELELRWDSRRSASVWEPRPIYSDGWLAGVYGGRVHRLDDGGSDFWRYGAEVQRFIRIGRGPRVLAARAYVEAVSGSRGEVPFFELPALGGDQLLRGYPTERFRDRIAALASLDYQWDLSTMLAARIFTDVGRVYGSAGDLELSDLRVGYGLGLDLYSKRSFKLRTSIASSIDGGVQLNLSFGPVFDLDGRVERR